MSGFEASASFSFGGGGGAGSGDALPLLRTFRFRVTLIWSPLLYDPATPPPPADALSDGDRICSAGFQECSGLTIAMEPAGIAGSPGGSGRHEGGNNGFVHALPGRASYGTGGVLTFKRGMMYSVLGNVRPDLWHWVQAIAYLDHNYQQGRMYCDGLIQVLGTGSDVLARWQFQHGLPTKIEGPSLSTEKPGIAIETLSIMPGRLWLTR